MSIFKYISTKKEMKKEIKGVKKITNKEFIRYCKYEKGELKAVLRNELKKYYKEVISKEGFLYARGNKIVLTAHMDTTPNVEYGRRKMVKDVYEYKENGKTVVHSPQGIGGDDRCGIYMIMEILKRTELRPTILFCEDEEIGSIGSDKFCETEYIKEFEDKYFIIELDRRGNNDCVFYEDENEEFHNYIEETTGYVEAIGSFSDISNICPICKVAGVNLSCGYFNEHHDYETVVLEDMERTLTTTIALIMKGIQDKVQYKYIERVYKWDKYRRETWNWNWNRNSYNVNTNYRSWYDEDDYEKPTQYYLTVDYDNGFGDSGTEEFTGDSIADVWYEFFSLHPNLTMSNVTDYIEWNDKDYSSL